MCHFIIVTVTVLHNSLFGALLRTGKCKLTYMYLHIFMYILLVQYTAIFTLCGVILAHELG